MNSSNGVASRTRSQTSSGYGSKYLDESSGKRNEHEIKRKEQKRKNLGRSIERETKRQKKHHPRGFEIDDEGIKAISEAEFRNSRRHNLAEGIEIESITKEEFEKCKKNDRAKGIKIETIDENESQDEIERISETEDEKSLRHDHEEGVEIASDDEEEIEFEIIDEIEFRSRKRRDINVEEIEVEESCPEEGSSKCRSEKDHKYRHQTNDIADDDGETNKESAGRNTIGSSDSEGNSEENNSKIADFQENETGSQGSGHQTNVCIASRTRSKRDVANKSLEADNVVSDSSNGSSSHSDSDSSADSWSSYRDEDDEDFVVENSDDSDSMELSSSYVEEDNDRRKMKRSGVKEFSDSNDEEECSRTSLDASSKVDEDEDDVEVRNLQDNSERTTRNVNDHLTVQEGNGIGSEREDLVRSSLDSNQMILQKKYEEQKVVNKIHFGKKKAISSAVSKSIGVARTTRGEGKEPLSRYEDTKNSEVGKTAGAEGTESENRYGSLKILQRGGKTTKSCQTTDKLARENKENAEDGDITKFDMHDPRPRNKCARDEEEMNMFEKNERPTRRRSCSQKEHDLCKNLLDAVLDENMEFGDDENREEGKKSTENENILPLWFRFEDEDTMPVEKSEHEVMIEGLFGEMLRCLKYGDMDVSGCQEVEKDDANPPNDETNQYALCCKGKHYLIEDDELRLICLYCLHVELEAKHVMPPWAEKTYRGSGRRLSVDEQASVPDGLNLEQDENFTGCLDLSKGTIWDIKPGIQETMYEHQREGLEFLWKNLAGTTYLNELEMTDSSDIGGCIISHAPGTGKTRLTMVFIETYLKLFPNCRPLIIAPASMLLTWEEEFRKWEVEFPFHNLNNLEMSGKESKNALKNLQDEKSINKDAARMIKIYSWNKGKSILGMSYRLFEVLAGKKSKSRPIGTILLEKTGLVVLDEGHTPRSRKSNIWNTLLKLKTNKRIILSGTPFQNNFEELFNILRIVRPATAGILAKERIFAEMISLKAIRLGGKYTNDKDEHQENNHHAIKELKEAMVPFVHVHKGTILQQSLPGLRDCVVLLNPSPLQKSLIDRIGGSQSTFKFDHKVALISVHPYLFKHCLTTENERKGVDMDALEASKLDPIEGVKTRYIMELVRLCAVRNEKVLIFSQYIKPLALIQRHLKKIFNWTKEKHILKMEGKMGQKKRQDLINAFNDPKSEARVLLASTKCCSEGINLVGASRVVLLDVVWNPSVEQQAISRAYRLGQKKIVYTYHLMTSGTTEGDKYCRQAEKERLSELVFTSSSNEISKGKNSDIGIEDEVLEEMVENGSLKNMFEKIINQPKEKNLMDTFTRCF